eukprot:9134553-Alexandrium_andersonii.AAC.3
MDACCIVLALFDLVASGKSGMRRAGPERPRLARAEAFPPGRSARTSPWAAGIENASLQKCIHGCMIVLLNQSWSELL